MTKASVRLSERDLKRRNSGGKRDLTGWWLLGGAAVISIVLIVVSLQPPSSTASSPIPGVVAYSNLTRGHSSSPQVYAQVPPVGGDHNPVWQNCGIYDQPVQNENAVHSMEHGAVWITYRPDLPANVVENLRALVRGHASVLLSPYPNLPKPVVASAWGLQLPLDDPADARIAQFISVYERGAQTPEPGATCDGGTGTPLSN
jgi:Protein of unknown function (DUF3105)